MNKKIKAYRKALSIAHNRDNSQAKNDKCLLLANKLFTIEREYWNILLAKPVKRNEFTIPVIDFNLLSLDVTIQNPVGATYELSINDIRLATGLTSGNRDVYGTGFPLPTDKETVRIDTTFQVKSIRVLHRVRDKNQDTNGTFPVHAKQIPDKVTDYNKISSDGLFDTSYKPVFNGDGVLLGYGLKKSRSRKKHYQTVVRRKTRDGVNLKARYMVEERDLIYLFHGQKKGYKATSRKLLKSGKDKHYISLTKFKTITDYLESITLNFLYNEKIRTYVKCKHCNRRATLKQVENSLGCSQCNKVGYNVTSYRIRYFYLDNFTRYELNERTGLIKKQVETFHGFKTLYHGKISP